ncbi:hypothetical protein [Streptomyces sp. NBC_01637]|uniref:hypothetical protein n=1 Tax=unclassified Streptomyces TaxID=2593676 RepID=UPI00386FDACA|nr:hypothetical protein OH719_01115 [Streptomyces sp. NBC_01653]WTC84482.1 hypothetical protein OH719_45755 [Streptomyces sp. NBC_01653]WTD86385.1 hypothetical protein OG891_01115 [Streptomyces sp. NBC_01637]WTD94139.1 hypothetical protein OG891_45750 [Streptomyces sp. NBC_01637]
MDVCPHEVSDGLRKWGRRVSQPDGDGGPVVDDVIDSEADDAGDGLRVEENECGGDPGSQGQGVVVEGPPEDGESAVLVQRRLVLVDDLGWQGEAGHPARLHAPAQERLGRAPGGQLRGVPGIEVGLLEVFDGAASVGEPGEEGASLGDLLFRLAGLGASQRPLLRFAPQVSQLMPGDEVLKTPTVFGVLDAGESFGQPTLIEHELSVDGRQDAAVHQQSRR